MEHFKLAFGILLCLLLCLFIVAIELGACARIEKESRARLLLQQKTSKLDEINQAIEIAEIAAHPDFKKDFWKKVFSLQSESSAMDVEIEKLKEEPMHDVIQN
eukprot:scaffold77824_cov56-Attheya_sp.AAC.5